MEDIHIINLFLERSEDAIRQVEVKYEKFCFKIAWNILYNTEDSEECVNDTWLITWNKIPPKTPTKLSAFLGKITRNLALDNFRKKNASKRADTHMMDICGEVEKLENTIKDYGRRQRVFWWRCEDRFEESASRYGGKTENI